MKERKKWTCFTRKRQRSWSWRREKKIWIKGKTGYEKEKSDKKSGTKAGVYKNR